MKKMIFRLSVLAASVAMAACGGGGAVQTPSYTLTGNAVKGPMKDAKVTVYRITADGKQGEKLGDGKSVEGGGYSVTYQTDYTGPILVEVEATADTDIYDEATKTTIKAPGLKLRAALQPPKADGGKLVVQVNPLTDVAVADAARQGGLTASNVEQANKKVADSLGFNPQTDVPTFDVAMQPTNSAAVVMAAISKLAKDGDLAICTGSTADRVKCVVAEVSKSVTGLVGVQALQAKVDAVASEAKVTAPVIKVPDGSPVTEITAVAQAKSLMSTLRSNAKALDASELSLQTELTAVNDAIDTAVSPVVDSTFQMLRTMDFGVKLLEDAQKGSGRYQSSRTGTQLGAGCSVYSDVGFTVTSTSKDDSKFVGCSSYSFINRNQQDSTTGVLNTWRWRHRLFIAPKVDVAGTYVVKTTARREYGTCQNALSAPSCGAFTQTYLGTPNQAKPVPVGSYTDNANYTVQRGQEGVAEFTRTFTGDSLTALRLTGSTAPSLVYQGLSVNPVIDNGRGRRHEVDLDVVKTVVNGVQRLSLNSDASIKFFSSNQADETFFMSAIGISKDSFIEAPVQSGAQDGTEKFDMRIGFVAGNSAIRGQLAASDAKWDKSKTEYSPTKITFGGRLERRTDGNSPWVEFLRGNIVMEALDFPDFSSNSPPSPNNPHKMKATTNAVVTIPTRPTLVIENLVVSGTDSGVSNSATMSGQYRQGSVVINLQGSQDASAKPIVTLESTTGIKLVVDDSKTVHPMTKSGVKVGEYNTATQRLNYIDGTFEQY